MWLSATLTGLVILSAPLEARVTRGWSSQEVEDRLRSTDPLDVAWAAHEAAERHLKRAVPALLDALESPPEGELQTLALEHTLDALIRLGAELGPQHTAALDPENRLLRDQLIVLAARTPGRFEAQLLGLFDRDPRGHAFHAVASLLAQVRSKGLGHRLLAEVETELTVTVTDPGTRIMGFSTGCGGIGTSGGSGRASGWPPPFDYELVLAEELRADEADGVWLEIAAAPRRILARRVARHARRQDLGRAPAQARVVEHLLDLAGLPLESVRVPARASQTVAFESREQVRAAIDERSARLRAPYDALRQSLATQGLLDRRRWKETELPITVVIEDERSDRSVPLDP